MIIPVSEWKPDLNADHGDRTAENVIAEVDSYLPWPSLSIYSNALDARCQGAFAAKSNAALSYDFAGDQKKLYLIGNQTWGEASRISSSTTQTYSTATDLYWEFVQWGETVLATNYGDPVQEITLGSTNFVNLAGTPPQAKHMAVVRDFVWLGNIQSFPQRVQWCGINNTHTWTVDANTQADFQDLPGDGGDVQRILGGNTAIIMQERAIWRAQYVGAPAFFDFGDGPIERQIGCLAPMSAVRYGAAVFYLAEQGFMFFDGTRSIAIGNAKVDRTFFADLDSAYTYRIQAEVDPVHKLYLCAYPGSGNTNGNPNKIMVYNFAVSKWTRITEDLEFLYRHLSTGYTLEGLDTVSTDIDALPASLDSPIWTGGLINLSAFDTNHKTNLFTGTSKDATVDTAEIELIPGRRAKITRMRPLVDALSASIAPRKRNVLSEAVTIGSAIAQNSTGDCPVRSNARYHGGRITTSGTFDHIRGIEVLEASDGGSR